ncbi:MAG: hypothetical protein ACLQPD_27235 [Desulfomonilaceae bacterium]
MIDFNAPQSKGMLSEGIIQNVFLNIIRLVLEITVKAWPNVILNGIKPTDKENKITNKLRWKMREERKKNYPVLGIRFLREPQVDRPDGTGEIGLIDIFVVPDFGDEEDYFAMECKKITSRNKAKAKEYIAEGVLRFVSGKYSLGHSYAAMIGYVLSGKAELAAKFIEKTLSDYREHDLDSCPEWPWQPETRFGNQPNLYSTMHAQENTQNKITLLHLFLAFQ